MVKSNYRFQSSNQEELEQRKRNKVNIRHTSLSGHFGGQRAWLKMRHRVRKRMLR